MTTLYTEGDTDAQYGEAVAIMELLTAAYPGHPWAVRVAGGVIFIRYLDDRMVGNWGMAMKQKDSNHDAAVLKREVIMKAGEWLERAGLARGRSNGDEIVRVEGLPDTDQPDYVTPLPVMEKVIAPNPEPLRTTPHRRAGDDRD
jgi:hypothetical protein